MILWVDWVVPLIWAGWSGMASLVDPEPQVTCRKTVGMVRASFSLVAVILRGCVHVVAKGSHEREPPQCQICYHPLAKAFPAGSDGRESTCSAGSPGLIPGLGRSPGGGNDNPLQYILAWRTPRTEEIGRLQSMGLQRVRHG